MTTSLKLRRDVIKAAVAHAQRTPDRQVCGLLGGHGTLVTQYLPVNNVAQDPRRSFVMSPQEMLDALRQLDAQQLTWLATYHSHPHSNPIPCAEDIAQARRQAPNQVMVIVSFNRPKPRLKAWHITPYRVLEVPLFWETQSQEAAAPLLTPSRLHIVLTVLAALLSAVLLLVVSITLLPPPPVLPAPIS